MDLEDVFSLPNGATTDIAGVIMYVSPLEHDTYFPVGMREVAVVDSRNHIVFLRILGELSERHREQLLFGERHYWFVMATSMEVDQASRSLLSTASTTIIFYRCLPSHQFDILEGVHTRIYNDSAYDEAVKNVVLLWRDAQKPANEYNAVQLPAQTSSIKHIFNYVKRNTPRSSQDQVNKYDEVD